MRHSSQETKQGEAEDEKAGAAAHPEARAQQANHAFPCTSHELQAQKGGTALERGVLARAIPP